MTTPRVIHTGQALVDLVLEVEHLPATGSDVMASSAQQYAGGAVNVLVAAARAGARAVHAGAHGTGPYGDLVRATLAAESVEVSSPPLPDADSGFCIVLIEPTAQRTFVTTQAAERQVSTALLDLSQPAPGDVICASGYTLLHPVSRQALLDWLPTIPNDATLVLDPGALFGTVPAAAREAVLARVDVWTSNADEATELSGNADPSAAATAIAAMLPRDVSTVVRDGPEGCHVHADGVTTYVPGFPQTPVDTNGAGDAHIGVFAAELSRGTPWLEAARRANAAGAIKVTRRGPATAPTRAEVDEFLAGRTG